MVISYIYIYPYSSHLYIPYLYHIYPISILLGGFNPSEKLLVNGKDYPIYYGK